MSEQCKGQMQLFDPDLLGVLIDDEQWDDIRYGIDSDGRVVLVNRDWVGPPEGKGFFASPEPSGGSRPEGVHPACPVGGQE
jgi:hypothetical protein